MGLLVSMTTRALFRHVVFPREMAARRVVNVALQPATSWLADREANLPHTEGLFLHWLLSQASLDASDYRSESLLRRLPACLRMLHVSTVDEARGVLERTPALIPPAVDVMLIGVTSFFRDPTVFEQLRGQLLPQLGAHRGGVYVWCAGCSDGAEVYTIAMLLAELGLLEKSYLLGTDCRAEAIDRLRSGCYSDAAIAGVPAELRDRYFTPVGKQWQVCDALKRHVRARQANVLGHREAGLWDVILCRNTSIYLRAPAAHRLWVQLETSLRVGGVLVLGKAERPVAATSLQCYAPCIFRKTRR